MINNGRKLMKRKAPSTKKKVKTISVYGCTLELVASYCIVRVHEHTVDLYAVCGPHCSSNGNCPYKDR